MMYNTSQELATTFLIVNTALLLVVYFLYSMVFMKKIKSQNAAN